MGLNLEQGMKGFLPPRESYAVLRYHTHDDELKFCGTRNSFDEAKLIAETEWVMDETQYNDCPELKGQGIGFDYHVINSNGRVVHTVEKITIH